MKRGLILWAPLAAMLALLGIFFVSLRNPNDNIIPSKMVGKPLPDITAPPALPGREGVTSKLLRDGKPRLLNLFGSYCIPCIAEAPVLAEMRKQGAEIVGIAIKDEPENLKKFLKTHGDPFSAIGMDDKGKVQISLGSSGVPETFVINSKGEIIYQHISAISNQDAPQILAMLKAAK